MPIWTTDTVAIQRKPRSLVRVLNTNVQSMVAVGRSEAEERVVKVERAVKKKGRGECDKKILRIKCSTFLSWAEPPKIWPVFCSMLTAQRRVSTGGQTPLFSPLATMATPGPAPRNHGSKKKATAVGW